MTSPATLSAPAFSPNLPLRARGKVRDIYELPAPPGKPGGAAMGAAESGGSGGGRLLFVASDRISAFDVVMPTPVPGKGKLLTRIAAWWLRFIAKHNLAETHLLSTSLADLPSDALPADPAARAWLDGRITIGRTCRVLPIECVVRGYLEGSGWKEYQASGSVCGVQLPRGLRQCDRLPEPIFTPATKAATGHDENITFDQAADAIGLETISVLRDMSLAIYNAAAAHALARGVIIADTKFEFGIPADAESRAGRVWTQPMVIDEALTPDSSRFWPADTYEPGRPQKSFDKQFLREHLEGLVAAGRWNKQSPGPELPDSVIRGTLDRYEQIERLLCT